MSTISVRDVAQLAGVSVGTVSNVLNQPAKVSRATVERVQGAIDKLGFVRNDAARQLRAGRSRSVGLVVLDVANPFFTDLARGAENAAAEEGLAILLGNSDENGDRERAYVDLFEEQRVHGLLISPLGEVGPELEQLRRRGTPVVLVDRDGSGRGFSSVSMDDRAGGELACRHLLDLGRRRIAFVGGSESIRQVSDRLSGARRAVASVANAQLDVYSGETLTVLEGRAIGERIAALPEEVRPDAIFAANDLLALGIIQALVMGGRLRVPEDIALIGYDDIAFAQSAVIPLSSVRQPSERIGRTAVELLLREVGSEPAEPENIVFQPELIIRSSTVGTAP